MRSQRSIIEYTALIKTVMINKRSIKNKGAYRGIKNDREDIIRIVPKMTTHPRAECLGNSLVVSRQQYHRLVATSMRVQARGKLASGPWDMRDYLS